MERTQARSAADRSDLVFRWKVSDHHRLRLGFFLFLALAAHIGCFYLFQVIYPKTERALPYTASVTVLDARDPLARDAMARVSDRVAGIDPADRRDIPGTQIEDHVVNFVPFFRDYTLRLKDPPSIFPPPETPDLFAAGVPTLPPTRMPEGRIPEARRLTALPFERLPHITVRGGDLENRDLEAPIDWSAMAERFTTTDGDSVEFLVGVDASGRVRHCLLSEGDDTGVAALLYRKVRDLRFVPLGDGKGTVCNGGGLTTVVRTTDRRMIRVALSQLFVYYLIAILCTGSSRSGFSGTGGGSAGRRGRAASTSSAISVASATKTAAMTTSRPARSAGRGTSG